MKQCYCSTSLIVNYLRAINRSSLRRLTYVLLGMHLIRAASRPTIRSLDFARDDSPAYAENHPRVNGDKEPI